MRQRKEMDWTVKYRENRSYWIEAVYDYKKYVFTTHALVRQHQRNNNINKIDDCVRALGRIIKVINNKKVKNWMDRYKCGDRLIVHDRDIYMMYIVVKKSGCYEIITTYNEFTGSYINRSRTPEIWIDIRDNYVVATM